MFDVLQLLHEVVQHIIPIMSDPATIGLMIAGGGGQPPAPAPPDYEAQGRASIAQQNNQARIDAETAARAKEQKASDDNVARAKFSNSSAAARNQALSYGTSRLNSMGIQDNYGILPAYEAEVARAGASIPDLDPSPGNYYTPTLFDNALSQQRAGQRTKLNQSIDSYAPQGFEVDKFNDNSDDAIINSIINDQYGNAGTYLTRAQARGQLDQTGYDYANQQLSNSRAGAVSRANTMGQGVLQKDRDTISNIAKDARGQVTNWDFGSTFNPDTYKGRIDSSYNNLSGSLEGDIRNAFGDTQFFDPTSLVTKGGAFQGQQNPGTAPGAGVGGGANPLLGAISDDLLQRSAGTQGAF